MKKGEFQSSDTEHIKLKEKKKMVKLGLSF